jgi:hypothetical protein
MLCGAIELFPAKAGLPYHRMHQIIIKLFIMNIYGNHGRYPVAVTRTEVLSMGADLSAFGKTQGGQYSNHFTRR